MPHASWILYPLLRDALSQCPSSSVSLCPRIRVLTAALTPLGPVRIFHCQADVAELADAQVSEACDGDIVEVQVLSSAPTLTQNRKYIQRSGNRRGHGATRRRGETIPTSVRLSLCRAFSHVRNLRVRIFPAPEPTKPLIAATKNCHRTSWGGVFVLRSQSRIKEGNDGHQSSCAN